MPETSTVLALQQKLDALERTVAALEAALGRQYRVTLQADNDRPFLGQPVVLTVRVARASDGHPAANVPVTFAASWGRLRAAEGFQLVRGNTVTLRTFPDGSARVLLLPPTSEPLLDEQAQAVVALLATLDPAAPTPQAIAADFERLVREYRWESNLHFREATDIFFGDLRARLTDTINRRDYLAQWEYYQATIMAHVGAEEENGEVRGSGVLNLAFKDWLAPWLETYLALPELAAALGGDIEPAGEQAADRDWLDAFHGRVQDFLRRERGLAGSFVGGKVARSVLDGLARSDLEAFEPELRADLADGLKAAAASVTGSGAAGLAGLDRIRAEARREAQREIAAFDNEKIAGLAASVGGLRQELGGKADTAALTGIQSAVNARIGSVERDFATQLRAKADALDLERLGGNLAERVSRLNESLAGKVDNTVFTGFRRETEAELNAKVELEAFTSLRQSLSANLKELSRRVTGFTVLETQILNPVRGTPITPVVVAGGISIGDGVIAFRPNRFG